MRFERRQISLSCSFAVAAFAWACSAGSGAEPGSRTTDGGNGSSGAPGPTASTGGNAMGSGGTVSVNLDPDAGALGGSGGDASCATQQADAAITRQPVDIIVVIDNSGSMQDEIDAVENSINVNFANILAASGVDYRVIMISRHEKKGRQTSICVVSPLSSTTVCPPVPDQPAFGERFYQYSLKVDSLDSLVLILDTYDASAPDEFNLAPYGWSAWLRADAKKVFLEVTDDNSDEMTSAEFDSALLAMAPEHFGTAANRKYTFHSIIGIAEKPAVTEPWLPEEDVQASLCTGNDDTVENHGPVYQELSRLSGGLRFPLCQFNAFDAVFETIASNVASHAAIACEFSIPPAPGNRTLDLSQVAVSYDPGDGSGAKTFGQAMTAVDCVPEAFYIDTATQRIVLCPQACSGVQTGLMPSIDVLFTCAPTFIPPPK